MSSTYVLYDSRRGLYFAGMTNTPKGGAVVITPVKDVASKFFSKKEAKDGQNFLDNNGYKFDIVELK